MFSNIGWGEIFFILIIGLIVIGPERLPAVVEDVRAAIYAAKKAINNAKAELNGELEGFEEFKKPIDTVSQYAAMGPRRAMAKVLFEDEAVDPRQAGAEPTRSGPRTAQPQQDQPAPQEKLRQDQAERPSKGRGFSWEDIT
ncbi:Sec-independent protein translocase protein TatB [Corynebacterium sp. HMSC034A01]|uniref:Sec-independent protein translocase protein TatB n=1 Tax=Corynebacterium sp. HMSC034A01 TaxID=1739295 RepID=UPI0008A88FDE|nr:Sec-independent protein translocase protein TatB [Corynebacterium sp. HMSC034A01]OHR20088.1 twin arginine-targeting protein translocase TatB [Corynebacterium sp. HMSC034A01]